MKLSKLTIAGGAAALMLSAAPAAFAAGTSAGTEITNSVTLTYTSGSQTADPVTASTSFEVDRKVDFVVENQVGGEVSVDMGSTGEGSMGFQIDSSSNDAIELHVSVSAPGDFSRDESPDTSEEPAAETYYLVDGSGDPLTWDSDADAYVLSIAEDGDATVSIVAGLPLSDADDEYEFTMTAEPASDESSASDIDDLSTMSTVHLTSSESDSATFTVEVPNLTATKDVVVVSQDGSDCGFGNTPEGVTENGQAAIPGACIEYVITVYNTGTASMRDLVVTDELPSQVSYVAATSNFFTDGEINGGSTVTATASNGNNLTNGEAAILYIRATIN